MDWGAVLGLLSKPPLGHHNSQSDAAAITEALSLSPEVESAFVYLVEDETLRPLSAAGKNTSTRRVLTLEDLASAADQQDALPLGLEDGTVVAPIHFGGELKGALIAEPPPGGKLQDAGRGYMGLLAAYLASAMALNARLDEMQASERRSQQLYEVVSAASLAVNLRSGLDEICSLVAENSVAERCTVLLYQEGQGRLAPHTSQGRQGQQPQRPPAHEIWLDPDVARRPVVSSDAGELAEHDPAWKPWIHANAVRSLAALPIAVGDRLQGLICVYTVNTTVLFPIDEIHFLETVASQIGVMIEKTKLEAQLRQHAITDPLTQLYNRRYLELRLEEELNRARRANDTLVVLLFDVDRLKVVNDTFGHLAGDDLLLKAAQVIRASCRSSDVAGRISGDEFMVILPSSNHEAATVLTQRLLRRIESEPLDIQGQEVRAEVSVGKAEFPSDATEARGLFAIADRDLYADKRRRRSIETAAVPTVPPA